MVSARTRTSVWILGDIMSVQGGWAIRFYNPDNFRQGQQIISNFKGFQERTLDDIVVFSGMYGLDSYMLWYIHKDLHGYDYNTSNLNLRLFADTDKNKSFWENKYRVVEVKYDPKTSRYVLFALSEDSIILNTKLLSWRISSIKWKEERKAYEVLEEILEENGILAVNFFQTENEELIDFTYNQITFDSNWSVRDFINYICDDNKYEWYVYNKVLYVGKELFTRKSMNISAKYVEASDQLSESSLFKKIQGDLRPADVLGHIDNRWRCIWAKHIVGKSGGMTKACFSKIGSGRVDKLLYLSTLEGEREINNATFIFAHNQFNSYSIGMGSILKDEGEALYVDEVSVQKDTDTYKVRNPNEMVFDRGNEDDVSRIVSSKEHVVRSTPYLDHNAGILFPSVELDNPPPNSIIFNIKGREESSVLGPFVMNNGKDLVIPFKTDKLDFRLQLPGGWCMYVDKDNVMVIEKNADPSKKPTGSGTYIKFDGDGNIITKGTKTKLQEGSNKLSHADHTHPLSSGTDGLFKLPLLGLDTKHPAPQGTQTTEAD